MTGAAGRAASLLDRAEARLGQAEAAAGIALVVAMAAIVNLQIVARYVFGAPFMWPEEVVRIALVWMTFLGAAAAVRIGAEIAVDTFVLLLPPRPRAALRAARDLLLLGLFGFVAWQAHGLIDAVGDLPLIATDLPTSILVWPVAIGAWLIALHALLRLLRVGLGGAAAA